MVSTRHSLPSAAAEPSPADAKTEKALKKLQILGNDALKGDMEAARKAKEKQQVYHYRGAVYAVEESTRDEWVENQPDRYKKRGGEEDATEGAAQSESEAEEARPAKRTRKSLPHQPETAKKAALRGRRNTMPAKPTRKRKAAPVQEPNNSRLYDFATVGGPDERVISANLPSWVAPSPEEREKQNGHRWRPTAKKGQLRPDQRKLQSSIAAQKASANTKNYSTTPLASTQMALTPAQLEERDVLQSILRLAAVKEQLSSAQKEYAQAKALLQLKQSEQQAPASPDIIVTSSSASEPATSPDPETAAADTEMPDQPAADTEMPSQPAGSPELARTSMPPPSTRRTPATGANTHGSPSVEPEDQISFSLSPAAAPHHTPTAPGSLPERDRGGSRLRWSLYATTASPNAGEEAESENAGRPEYRINGARLPDEGRQASRRRISREVAIVKSWARIDGGRVVLEKHGGESVELRD